MMENENKNRHRGLMCKQNKNQNKSKFDGITELRGFPRFSEIRKKREMCETE
jgi:hypothetical protein